MKRFLYVAAIIPLLVGCRSSRTEYVPIEKVKTITEVLRDTVVDIKLEPYKEEVATSADSSYLENPYAYSWARWDGKLLRHSLGIFDKPIPTNIQYIDRKVEVEVDKPYPVKGDTEYINVFKWWQTGLMYLGAVAAFILLGLVGLGLFKSVLWIKGKAG